MSQSFSVLLFKEHKIQGAQVLRFTQNEKMFELFNFNCKAKIEREDRLSPLGRFVGNWEMILEIIPEPIFHTFENLIEQVTFDKSPLWFTIPLHCTINNEPHTRCINWTVDTIC